MSTPGPTAPARLARRSYGKHGLRVVDLRGGTPQRAPVELTVDVAVRGGLAQTYLGQDNGEVVPSDALRNAAVAALEQLMGTGQAPDGLDGGVAHSLASEVARRVLGNYPWLPAVAVSVTSTELTAVACSGPNIVYLRHAVPGAEGAPRNGLSRRRDRAVVSPGRRGDSGQAAGDSGQAGGASGQAPGPVALEKSTGSVRRLGVVLSGRHRFAGYHGAAAAPPPPYRVLLGTVSCKWSWATGAPPGAGQVEVVGHLLAALAEDSESVQHLLAGAAGKLLASYPQMERARLTFRSLPVASLGPPDRHGRPLVVLVQAGHTAVTTVGARQAHQAQSGGAKRGRDRTRSATNDDGRQG